MLSFLRNVKGKCFFLDSKLFPMHGLSPFIFETSRGAGAQACNYKRDRLWIRFPLEDIKYFHFF